MHKVLMQIGDPIRTIVVEPLEPLIREIQEQQENNAPESPSEPVPVSA
jgi:hypothetical protein